MRAFISGSSSTTYTEASGRGAEGGSWGRATETPGAAIHKHKNEEKKKRARKGDPDLRPVLCTVSLLLMGGCSRISIRCL